MSVCVVNYKNQPAGPDIAIGWIINSSLPIGCQFIWETKLTLKSHKIILEKSWWSFLVVVVAIAIVMVIALIIAVVIVKVWSSPKFPYLLLLCIFLCTKQGDWRRHISEFPLPFSGDLYSCRNNSMSMLTWVAALPASQRRKGEGEGSSWCSGKLT